MLLKRRALRGERLSRLEIFVGVCFLALIVLMTVLAICLNLWWLEQEEAPEQKNAEPGVTVTTPGGPLAWLD
jgi:hypothetical protein